jgi:transposase InsO family protein
VTPAASDRDRRARDEPREAMKIWLPSIPLPSDWPALVQTALLHAIALGHFGVTHIRGWCENSRLERVRLIGENERLRCALALTREQMDLKDARMKRIPPAHRPHYLPTERLRILELKAARAWNNAQTARAFLVTEATIASWLRRLDEHGPGCLVQTPTPVNRFPDFVAHLVQRLKALLPAMGKVRITQLLARAGLHLSATTAHRMVNRSSPAAPPPAGEEFHDQPCTRPSTAHRATSSQDAELPAAATLVASGRTVTANYSDHVWNVDLTVVPISSGLWTAWLRAHALPQCWPFAWWVVAVVDHFSRQVIDLDAYFRQPSAADVCALLERAVATAGRPPKYTVTDQGGQFQDEYRNWCRRLQIKPRFGAVGKSGSIALIERFWRTLKTECTRAIVVPLRHSDMREELSLFVRWFAEYRPHQGLDGRTPREVYEAGKVEPFRLRAANDSPMRDPPGRRSAHADLPRLELRVSYLEGRHHLPVVELHGAA